jgi:Alkylmercury lyase
MSRGPRGEMLEPHCLRWRATGTMAGMDPVSLRREIYRHYAATGRPPALAADELAALEGTHAVVSDPAGAIAFANPFATGPTPFRVETDHRALYSICAWDALGVLAALETDGTVQTQCPDCAEAITVRVPQGAVEPAEAVVHFLLPAARWYEDLGFT